MALISDVFNCKIIPRPPRIYRPYPSSARVCYEATRGGRLPDVNPTT